MSGFATDADRNDAIARLRAEGYVVDRPEFGPWEKPRELWKRVAGHLTYSGFYSRLRAFTKPYPQKCAWGGLRLGQLRSTPELIAWLARPAEAGKRRDLNTACQAP